MQGRCALTAAYAKTREQFGRPIGTFQAVSQRLADGYIDVLGQRLTLWQAAWRLAEGLPADAEVAIAKLWAADAGHRLAHTTVHVHGGVGIDLDGEAHRYFTAAKRFEFARRHDRAGAARSAAPSPPSRPDPTWEPRTFRQLLLSGPRTTPRPGLRSRTGPGPGASTSPRRPPRGRCGDAARRPGRDRPHVGGAAGQHPGDAARRWRRRARWPRAGRAQHHATGSALLADVRRSDCQVVLTEAAHAAARRAATSPGSASARAVDHLRTAVARPGRRGRPTTTSHADLHLGHQRRAQGGAGDRTRRSPFPGWYLAERFAVRPPTTSCYVSMPLFHSNAVIWPAGRRPLAPGATMAPAHGSRRPGSSPTCAATARRT